MDAEAEANQQNSTNKRKQFLRCDAVVGDDDNKLNVKPSERQESFKKRSSTASHSKDSSITDSTGVNILHFVETTLHKNAKDREFLLEVESDLRKFVADENRSFYIYPPLSSYNRMLVHRVAEFFGLIHNVDQSGQRIVVSKYKDTRLPDIEFSSLIKHSNYCDKYNFSGRNVKSFDEGFISGETKRQYPLFKEFRNRFYTNGRGPPGQANGDLFRERRARSFEMGEWFGLQNVHHFPPPGQFPLGASATLDYAGDAAGFLSSNCSSTASSSAIPAQLQSLHLPLRGHQQQFVQISNAEVAMLSPSSASAYSEPVMPHNYAPLQQSGEKQYEDRQGKHAGNDNNLAHIGQQQMNAAHHPHIPSLLAVQPIPPMYEQQPGDLAYAQQYSLPYYQPIQATMMSPVAAPNFYEGAICYQNFYPMYRQPIIEPHPLLEYNGTRELTEKLDLVSLSSEEPKQEAAVNEQNQENKNEISEKGVQIENSN